MKKNIVSKIFISWFAAAFSLVAAGAVFDLDYSVPERATPAAGLMKSALASAADPLDAGVLRQDVVAAPQLEGLLAVGDELNVTLFNDRKMRLYLAEQTPASDGVSSFLATADGYDGEFVAVVVQMEGRIQIDIQDYLAQRVYSVLSSEERTIVREMDPHRLPVEAAPEVKVPSQGAIADNHSTEEPTVEHGTPPEVSADNEGTPTVDILVAYDTDAATWAKSNGGISGFAETQVQKMNTAIANTGLNNYFRFKLAGVYEIGYSAGGDISAALSAAYDDSVTINGHSWSGLRAKRDEVEADIVCVLVDNGSSYGTTGIGNSLKATVVGFSEYAYNACLIRAVYQGHTMTHEVGHNMGAGHAKEMASSLKPGPQYHDWSSGYYFYIGSTGYHTIMAYNNDGYGNYYTSVPYFSSPSYTYNSVAVGDADHDNTRTLRETYLETSKYRGSVVAPALGTATETESYTWETSALYPWTRVTSTSNDGVDSARSGTESPNTWMRTRVVGPATLTFYYNMYSYFGSFEVTCDGSSLFSRKNEIVTDASFTKVTASIPAGTHVVKFAYTRSLGTGWYPNDGVWVDQIVFSGGSPVTDSYTVTYKPGANGSGSQQTATKTKNVALTLKGAIFTRTGYTQTGWATSDGGSKAYNLGASYTANADITLYPYWTASGPANDSFSSPTTISGASGSTSGSNVGATMQTSEKKPSAQSNSGASVWYKWTAPSSGTATFDTIGSGFDTVLAVYTGTSVSSLSEVASDDDNGGSGNTSKLTFEAVSGTTYRIAIYGYSSNAGNFNLKWSLAVPTYTVTYKPGANGSGSQQTATKTKDVALTLKGAIFTRTGYTQTGWATSDGGSKAYNLGASYTANETITLYPYWTASSSGPANDSFSSPTTISGASGSTSGSSVGATMQTSEKKPSAQMTVGASVWYKWTAPSSGTATLDTIGSGFDTVLAVYTGTSVSSLSEVASDDDNGGSGNTSKLTFQAVSGTTYWIAIYGYNGATGNFNLKWSLAVPTYTVTYKPGTNGSGSQQTATKTKDVALTLKGAIFTRTGYTQTGWATSDGGSKAYNLGASYTANETITLYPYWTASSSGPANDSFSSPTTISGASGSTSGSSVGGTLQTSEKRPSTQTTVGASVWYKWTAPSSGPFTFDTIGSSFDTVLAVYTGTSVSSLSEVVSDDDNGGSGNTSKLTFQAVSGTTYRIAVYGYNGAAGNFNLRWTISSSGPANDNFSSPTTISGASGSTSGSSVDATMQTSEKKPSAQASVGASVWYKWTAPDSGTVTFDTIGSSFDTVLAVYTGTSLSSLSEVVSDDDGGGSGYTSKLSFEAVSGTTYSIAVYGYGGETGSLVLRWSLVVPPPPPAPCYAVVDESDIKSPYEAKKAVTLKGAAYDGCDVVGIVELKLGKVNAKKGTSKVSGSVTTLDGKKHTAKGVTVTGIDGTAPAAVSLEVKGIGTMNVAIGGAQFAGTLGGTYHVQSAAVGGAWSGGSAVASVEPDGLSAFSGEVLSEFIPMYEVAAVSGGKWKFAKAASVKWAKAKGAAEKSLVVDTSKGTNLSGLKFTYTPKKGTFKGSFSVYALEGAGSATKLKKYKLNVSGVVVGGVGYGVATSKKPALSWPVTVK